MNYDKFIKNVSTLRSIYGISGVELSAQCDLRQKKRILDLESGRGKITIDEVVSICKFFGQSIDDMINKEIVVDFKFK